MGNSPSTRDKQLRAQEEYVNQRMKQSDMQRLSHMRGGFFRPNDPKYNDYQLKAYLRQEFNGSRKSDSYVLDYDLHKAGVKPPKR